LTRYASSMQNVEAGRNNLIDYFVMGHWHDRYDLPVPAARLMVNGSIIGTTEYDLGSARLGQPKQVMFGMKREHGITHRWDICLDKPSFDVQPLELYPPAVGLSDAILGAVPKYKVA